jgi:hypothetical protein
MTDVALDRPTPTRFGADLAWSEAAARPLRWAAGPGARASAAEMETLSLGLLRRDEPAAALARALRQDRTVTMAQIRSALDEGLTDESPAPLHDFFTAVEQRPDWVDDELLERGGQACRAFGLDTALVLTFGSLLGGYRTSAALEPLVRTGRLTGEETLRRIGETTAWWRGVTAPGGLKRDGDGWRLAVHVRVMHGLVNQMLEQDPTWDWAKRGVPINQYDQASTLGVFSTSFMLHVRLLGRRISRADSAAIMHLWSYVGWLMGVDEEWLPRTERQGRRVLYRMLSHDPPPDASSTALAKALMGIYDQAPMSPLRRRFERERGLSVATWLLGPSAMRDLELPARLPWYALFRVASNVFWSHIVGRLPGGQAVLINRSERWYAREIGRLYPGQTPAVGTLD